MTTVGSLWYSNWAGMAMQDKITSELFELKTWGNDLECLVTHKFFVIVYYGLT